jgi:hypothetical protein
VLNVLVVGLHPLSFIFRNSFMASFIFPDSEKALIMELKSIESGFMPFSSTLEMSRSIDLKSFCRVKAATRVVYVIRVGLCPSSIKLLKIEWASRGFPFPIKTFISFVLERTILQRLLPKQIGQQDLTCESTNDETG